MKQSIVLPGQGKSYDWGAKDHVFVKAAVDLSDGRLTLVQAALNAAHKAQLRG